MAACCGTTIARQRSDRIASTVPLTVCAHRRISVPPSPHLDAPALTSAENPARQRHENQIAKAIQRRRSFFATRRLVPLNQVAKFRRLAVQTGLNTLLIRLRHPLLTVVHKARLLRNSEVTAKFCDRKSRFCEKRYPEPFCIIDVGWVERRASPTLLVIFT